MSDIPSKGLGVEKVFESLPVTIHLGDLDRNRIIGWSTAYRDKEDGTTTIVMSLDAEASEKLGDLTEVFKLWAIGFSGIARKEEPR